MISLKLKELYNSWNTEEKIDENKKYALLIFLIMGLIFLYPFFANKFLNHQIKKYFIYFTLGISIILLSITLMIASIFLYQYKSKCKIINNNFFRWILILLNVLNSIILGMGILIAFLMLHIINFFNNRTAKNIQRFYMGLVNRVLYIVTCYLNLHLIIMIFEKTNFQNFLKSILKKENLDFPFLELVIVFFIIMYISDIIYKLLIEKIEFKYFYKKFNEYDKFYFNIIILGTLKYSFLAIVYFIVAAKIDFIDYDTSIINAITFSTLVVLAKDKSKEYKNKLNEINKNNQ